MPELRIPDIIIKKRDGKELTKDEIDYFINGVVDGHVTDAQTGMISVYIMVDGGLCVCLWGGGAHINVDNYGWLLLNYYRKMDFENIITYWPSRKYYSYLKL